MSLGVINLLRSVIVTFPGHIHLLMQLTMSEYIYLMYYDVTIYKVVGSTKATKLQLS